MERIKKIVRRGLMNCAELKEKILSNEFNNIVWELYCSKDDNIIEKQRKRYLNMVDKAFELYKDGDYFFVSSPGRAEIGGNHTDHQRGKVVAAAISIDNLCIVKKSDDNIVEIRDDIFGENIVDLSDLKMHKDEINNTKSIIRGVGARYKELSYNIGGFKAYQDIEVLVGSGLSSSACFEVLITEIYNHLYNDGKISAIERAKISKWAENNYFGKPCGLMDQMAISVGSFVYIDFFDNDKPIVKKCESSFDENGYQLLIIDSKANHSNLTDEYAAIPSEMKLVANYFDKEVLSEVSKEDFIKNISKIREKINNDRAIMRAYHFFTENERAEKLYNALNNKNIEEVLKIMNNSGNSSFMNLQNVYPSSNTNNEAVAILIALSKEFLGDNGIARVQGGGFAGTMMVVVKKTFVKEFEKKIEAVFGKDAIMEVSIRKAGTKVVF